MTGDSPNLAPASAQPRPPPRVPDHELLCRIGGGSYGQVWLARSVMGTFRAVKVIYRDEFADERPFQREFAGIERFEPISRLHESQVDILHVGRNNECFYYVMELADDQATGQQIDPDRYAPKTIRSEIQLRGKLPLDECLEIALSLTTALENLHSHKLVHRDIKPSNIIFIAGTPKLADIGLVTGTDATRSYVGTEGYIPPEGPGAPQADFYSLGKVLYEISTGKDRQDFPEPPAFWDGNPDERAWLEFHEVLLKACETDPRRRYQSAQELRAELELLRGGKSVRRLHTLERRLAVLTRLGLGAAALLALTAAGYLFSVHEAKQARKEAQRADQEAVRAKRAEAAQREQLWEAYLLQAQARRWSGRMGRRFQSLEALRKAAEIRPSIELRNEAFACLGLSDIGPGKEWDARLPGTTMLILDPTFHRYARADDTGDISLRRVSDDQELFRLPGPGVPTGGDMAFSPDSQWLAVFYRTNDTWEPWVWDLRRQAVKLKASGIKGRIFAFSPDSHSLAVAQNDGPIVVYDLISGQPIHSLEQQPLPYSMSFSPGGQQLAVSSDQSRVVRIRDVETGGVLQSLTHSNGVRCVAWDPSGELLATACGDHNVYVWSTVDGRLCQVLAGHQGEVTGISYNHRGDLLLSSAWDSTMRLWDPLNSRLLLVTSVEGGGGFSADGRWLVYSPDGPKIRICEVADGAECRCLRLDPKLTGAYSCDFNSDGSRLISAHDDGARIWNLGERKEVGFLLEKGLRSVRFQRNGLLLTGGGEGLKKRSLEEAPGGSQWRFGLPALFGSPTEPVASFSCSEDGHTIGRVQGKNVLVFNAKTGALKLQLGGDIPFLVLALSPNGKWAAGAANQRSLARVWNLEATNIVQDLTCPGINNAAFSPDSKWLLTSTWSEYRFWAAGTWQAGHRIPRSITGGLHGRMAFSPDSRTAAVTHSGQSVRLVDVESGDERATFEMPEPQVISGLAFSPDGNQLAVCGQTPVIYIWNLRLIRQQLATMHLDWSD